MGMSLWIGRMVAFGVIALAGVALVVALLPLTGRTPLPRLFFPEENKEKEPAVIHRVNGERNSVQLAAETVRALGIQTVAVRSATQPRQLELSGWLALDTSSLARVHSRFSGEVVQLGKTTPDSTGREWHPGDTVEVNQLLAIVWSKDLGEKKSELLDAISQLRLDEKTLEYLEQLLQAGNASEASVRQMRRNVESGKITVAKIERTLRSWRLTDQEIDAIKAEADRLRRSGKLVGEKTSEWAKVEVRARTAGTILEKNVVAGDIVDTTTDLFKIASLDRLMVWAQAYEEDLPALLSLTPQQRRWTLRLKADPAQGPIEAPIDRISDVVDLTQHTALVAGRINNVGRRLRAGQFVTATVNLPALPYEVLVPTGAVVEDGREAIVFVQPDPTQPIFTMRQVAIARRLPNDICIRNRLSADEQRQGLQPLGIQDRVVSAGVIQLRAALRELQETPISESP